MEVTRWANSRPHPVARAVVDGQAARNDDPTEDEVRAALEDNPCRRGARNRIVRAVLAAAPELRSRREDGG
jgi:nicotinate dehydrogenase subunit A